MLFCLAPVVAQSPDLSGRWVGEWRSDANGHHGPLKARFRKVDDCTYQVTYRGRFFVVVPFVYRTSMTVTGEGPDTVMLLASKKLPLVGEFRSEATATATDFQSTFQSGKDSGQFLLRRR